MIKSLKIGILLSLIIPSIASAQSKDKVYQVVTTAVPFLTISPDSRAAALGDAGVANSASASSIYWNTAALAFSKDKFSTSASYAPWLSAITNDMGILTVQGAYKINDKQSVGIGITYFNQGEIQFTNAIGDNLNKYVPREFNITAGFAQKLGENLSAGLNLKFINSNLVGNFSSNGEAGKPGRTAAIDFGIYRHLNTPGSENKKLSLDYGMVLQNIGGRVNYGFGQYFIPANIKLGGKLAIKPDEVNNINILLDFNKLLVPTKQDNKVVNQKSIFSSMISSFSDAPNGIREELAEITTSIGVEYNYANLLALRTGYFYESADKGNRQYITTGLGISLKDMYKLDLAYLIPTTTDNPMANSWRVTLNIVIPDVINEN